MWFKIYTKTYYGQNIPWKNVHDQNVSRTTSPTEQNVLQPKYPTGQNITRTKHPTGQNVLGHNILGNNKFANWQIFRKKFLLIISALNYRLKLALSSNIPLSIVPTMFCLVTIYYPPKKSSDFFKSRLHRKNSLIFCCILLCHNF